MKQSIDHAADLLLTSVMQHVNAQVVHACRSFTMLAQLAVPRKETRIVSGPDATSTFVSTDGSRNTCDTSRCMIEMPQR